MLSQFNWYDIVDILVVAYITYRVMLFFVGTRGLQIARGMLILAVAAALVRALDLRTVSWLLSHLFGMFLVAIPIVFQPELRRFLEALGRGNVLGGGSAGRKLAEENAKALIAALAYLKEHKIGALVVLERETGLKDLWRSAVKLRAHITSELLISIFWYGTPLHDGAVIMDRQQIVAAAAILPLTDNPDIARSHGTRHRAAVGVSEQSDCIVLVVSEERGVVSLAIRGKISPHPLDEKQVAAVVNKYFMPAGGSVSFWERLRRAVAIAQGGDNV
ncbi:membrane protein [Alphaproteobacteria bacterium]|nr:membrane protein [Alphaproteobacteria bacterium]